MVEIDPALMFDEVETVTISLQRYGKTGFKAKKYGESRSGLIAHLALTIE
jgi:hypothetical protein